MKTAIIKIKEGCTECKECPLNPLPLDCRDMLIKLGIDCEEYDITKMNLEVKED